MRNTNTLTIESIGNQPFLSKMHTLLITTKFILDLLPQKFFMYIERMKRNVCLLFCYKNDTKYTNYHHQNIHCFSHIGHMLSNSIHVSTDEKKTIIICFFSLTMMNVFLELYLYVPCTYVRSNI